MRILFVGASDLGHACCEQLVEIGEDVVGILTAPQDFRISWSVAPVRNVRHRSFENLAAERSIDLHYMRTRMADTKDWIAARRPDLFVVVGWYHMIGRTIRELASLGAVGIHASLLPKYRGGAPLVWAMINGERTTGVTLFHFADGVDDGDIIGQQSFSIDDDDTIAEVVEKSRVASVGLIQSLIPRIRAGNAPRMRQDQSQATLMPQRKPEDGLLDWSMKTVQHAHDWVRAQTRPYPGAFTLLQGEKLVIWRTSIAAESGCGDEAGTLCDGRSVVCSKGGLLRLDEVQLGDRLASGHDVDALLSRTTRLGVMEHSET